MKKLISLFLVLTLAGSCLIAGCSTVKSPKDDPVASITAEQSKDKYRNYYQIFVNSFCDSDGDSIGDLNGIISQLDYLNDGDPNTGNDLGIDGIWLTPIMPSKSYHKYDVEDYYDVDENFGTLEIFDNLIDECHKRGINVIIDLVLNHISSQNPLYREAVKEVAEGKLDGKAEYFEIHKKDYFSQDTNVNVLANGYACEANFSPDMPEWNLNSEKTREEFTKIAKFWLVDHKVDGFRLDAVKYYTNKDTDGVEFLKWFYETCQEIKPDVYMVGEDWEDDMYIEGYYKSGIDSLFAFKFSTASGTIIKNMLTQKGEATANKLKSYDEKMTKSNKNYINAMFLSNHDQIRAANALEAYGTAFEKFAASVYMLSPGNSFTYYGEEIGMTSPETTNDKYYRTGMIFDSTKMPEITINAALIDQQAPADGGVKQQLENDNSLLKFYQRVIKVKNQNPEIARGKITETVDFDDSNVGAFIVEYDGSKVMVIHNFNRTDSKTLTITNDMLKKAEVRADLLTTPQEEHIVLNSDGTITMPPLSTVVLKSAE